MIEMRLTTDTYTARMKPLMHPDGRGERSVSIGAVCQLDIDRVRLEIPGYSRKGVIDDQTLVMPVRRALGFQAFYNAAYVERAVQPSGELMVRLMEGEETAYHAEPVPPSELASGTFYSIVTPDGALSHSVYSLGNGQNLSAPPGSIEPVILGNAQASWLFYGAFHRLVTIG